MRSSNRTALVVVAPVGGLLGDSLGYRPMLWAAAVGFLLVAIALAASGFRSARLPDGRPGPPA